MDAKSFIVFVIWCSLCATTAAYYNRPRCGRDRPKLPNGYYTLEDQQNNTIRAHCNTGFQLAGSEIRFCNPTTGFTGDNPSCEDVDECSLFLEGSGGSGWPDEVRGPCDGNATCNNVLGSYTCTCNMGYYGSGFSCNPLPCSYPNVSNADMQRRGNYYMYGHEITFTCAKYHGLWGHQKLRCLLHEGRWDHEPPMCVPYPRCSEPVPMLNGRIEYRSQKPYLRNSFVIVSCNSGYVLSGPNTWKCNFKLQWEGQTQTYCKKTGMTAMGDILREKIDQAALNTRSTKQYNEHARFSPYDPRGVDLVFLLDTSSSITKSNFDKGIAFLTTILEELRPGRRPGDETEGFTRVAIITFADKANTTLSLEESSDMDFDEIKTKMRSMSPGGGSTNLIGGLTEVGRSFFGQRDAMRIMFLISDGEANDMTGMKQQVDGLTLKMVEIFTIGVGSFIRRDQLERVCSSPTYEHLFILNDYDDFAVIKNYIIEKRNNSNLCGVPGDINGPVHGPSNKNAWPWNALVTVVPGSLRPHHCGGSLICKDWVVTSAQCVHADGVPVHPNSVTVKLGAHYSKDSKVPVLNVKAIITHPDFLATTYPNSNDIALLKLMDETPLGSDIRTVCIPRSEDAAVQLEKPWYEGFVHASGWGTTQEDLRPGQLMHHTRTKFMKTSECEEALHKANISEIPHTENLGCLESTEEECSGDLGGPVVWKGQNEKFFLVGVPTYNSKCHSDAGQSIPNIVTKTRPHLAWIARTTQDCNSVFGEKRIPNPSN